MKDFTPTDQHDARLRVLARFARFCMTYVEHFLCLQSMAQSLQGDGYRCGLRGPDFVLIAAITRITAIAAMLMRYVEKPRAPRRYGHTRAVSSESYRQGLYYVPVLPLGNDIRSLMVQKMSAKARLLIRRDQLHRFGKFQHQEDQSAGNRCSDTLSTKTFEPRTAGRMRAGWGCRQLPELGPGETGHILPLSRIGSGPGFQVHHLCHLPP